LAPASRSAIARIREENIMTAPRFVLSAVTAAAIIVVPAAPRAAGASQTAPAATPAQTAAVTASPDLTAALSKELGSTPEQAAGAAGALFGAAKTKLKPTDFASISKAVPGMAALLKAAPALGQKSGAGALTQMAGAAGGLASAASAFQALGLSPDLVSKALPVLTSFVTKSGGADVGKLLAGALK
jgi:hypothetical protein